MPCVLLVDDDARTLRAHARQLKHAVELRTAEGVAEARAILDDGFVPDVVISDYMMPDGGGIAVLDDVKARCPKAKRYIATGSIIGQLPELVHELAAQNRQGCLSLSGEIMIVHEGTNYLITGAE